MGRFSDPLSAAQKLQTVIRATRQETETARRLAPQVLTGLIETGLCRLALPEELDGHGAEPVVALQVFEALAWGDASAAWTSWNNQFNHYLGRHLSDKMRRHLFGDPNLLVASSSRPSGKAVVVDGGFRASGRWSLVSGCEQASWMSLMCVVTDGDEPKKLASGGVESRGVYIPEGSYRIIDTWRVGGLRGTGSHDVEINDVFAPVEQTFSLSDPIQSDWPLYHMPLRATNTSGCAAICLGIAQAAIDALIELGASKVQVHPPGAGLRDRQEVQSVVASSAAALDAARLLLHTAMDDVWSACRQGKEVTEALCARLWGGAFHAAKTAKTVVTSMYESAGSSALYIDCPIERAHRDIHAVCQHVVLSHSGLVDTGRVLLGLPPNNSRFL